ncbi:WD repeat domain phosphoinositide-interacting protein 4-like isoform X2 [Cylas formicarius]|uniref:WD repeat domain phosphoinositide-interacting protein 4-like isoform X2 n=1 Tax=Cylas formicarius TaxID=197179 RepID=UPI002958A728|nr:WD repeat domain phosphoinositide-interacting protein 4-like isoform X2 [Cylas formicarius]
MSCDRRVISLRFNQDQGCFSCCMESGIRIYNLEPLVEKSHYDTEMVGSVSQCEMLFRTNILAIVSGGARPKMPDNILHLYDDSKKKVFMEIKFSSSIRAVRLRRDKIVVALLNKIHVFSILYPTQELFSLETRDNYKGLCEVSPLASAQKEVLIFPGHKLGSVQIVDISNTEQGISSAPVYIAAHKNELACLALNQQGTKIATASCQGTLIRVWDTSSRNLLQELRRGSDAATVYCINFSRDSDYLCCSSDKGTVHIFAIKQTNLNKRMAMSNVGILGKYGESQWGLAHFTVSAECACLCAFGPQNSVYALCLDGTAHKYVFSSEGICNMEVFDVFLDVDDDDDEF